MICIGLCDMCVRGFGCGDEVSDAGTGGKGARPACPRRAWPVAVSSSICFRVSVGCFYVEVISI